MNFSIKVPGSTANLGPGFDSVGMALNRYLTLDAKPANSWRFISSGKNTAGLPEGKENLIYKTASSIADEYEKELNPYEVIVKNEIPLSRGMGSSAAAIVAGIELADFLLHLNLTDKEKAHRASKLEGHPDNVAASIYGGLVIGSHRDDDTDIILGGSPDLDLVAVIPDYELKTIESRRRLPANFLFAEAVKASSISNVLVAALLQGNWRLAGKMMEKDLFHQPYRNEVVPELKMVSSLLKQTEAYGVCLSGAGPVVLSIVPTGRGAEVLNMLKNAPELSSCDIQLLKVAESGASLSVYC